MIEQNAVLTKAFMQDLFDRYAKFLDKLGEQCVIFSENLGVFPKPKVINVPKQFATLELKVGPDVFPVNFEPGGFFTDGASDNHVPILDTLYVSLAASCLMLGNNYKSGSFTSPERAGSTFFMMDREFKSKYSVMCKQGLKADMKFEQIISAEVKDKLLLDFMKMPTTRLLDMYNKIPVGLRPPSFDKIAHNNQTLANGILRAFNEDDVAFAKYITDVLGIDLPYDAKPWQVQALTQFSSRF